MMASGTILWPAVGVEALIAYYMVARREEATGGRSDTAMLDREDDQHQNGADEESGIEIGLCQPRYRE